MNPLSTAQASSVPHHRQPALTQPSGYPSFAGRVLALLIPALTCALAPIDAPAKPREASPTHGEVAEKKGDLKELRGQIDNLRKGVAAAENTRSDAADQLKDVEQEISGTQRELHKLGEQRDRLQTTLKELANQSRELQARLSRQHNNANVLCLGARIIGVELAQAIVEAFLGASFEGGRHQRRIDMINLPGQAG